MPLEDVYKTEARFLEHLQIQASNISTFATEVGATSTDQHEIAFDAANAEFLIETCNSADEFKKTAFAIKAQFFSNKTTPPVGAFSTPPDTTPPDPLEAGAIKRARERDQRFLHATGITEAAKSALDLVGPEGTKAVADTVKPTFEAFPSKVDYLVSIVTANRGESDQWELWKRPKGGEWTIAGSATGKSADFHLTPSTPGEPIALDLQIRLKRKNESYGQPSDIVPVTLSA